MMKNDIETLKQHYGNHSRAAESLGMTIPHYRRVRRAITDGKVIKDRVRILIQDRAKLITIEKSLAA